MTTKPSTAAAQAEAPGYPGAALDAAIHAARLASPLHTGADGALHLALPEGFLLHRLPDDRRLPPWPRQRVTVDDRASLIDYAKRHRGKGSVIIADFDKGQITARLDWHPHNQMDGWGEAAPDTHSVTLELRLSEEFRRWDAMAGKLHPQADFARFLEENATDVGPPEAAAMIELSRDFEATVGQVHKSSVRLDNGDRRLVFESDTKVPTGVVVPGRFTLSIPIYNGEEPDTLTCLFRWRAAPGGGVVLGFEWHRLEHRRRAHFAAIATGAADETGLPVYFGRLAG
ncbi:MAG TPA: DUF2303 family protein [Paracoccaceae bacterium]|nr:DUF2303 family protein [Paracoccaceae bacterium]